MGLGSMAIGPSRDLWPDLPRFAALMTLVFREWPAPSYQYGYGLYFNWNGTI